MSRRLRCSAEDLVVALSQSRVASEHLKPQLLDSLGIVAGLAAVVDAAEVSDGTQEWVEAEVPLMPLALENVNQAIAGNEKAYYMWIYKAKIQKEMGDNAGAMESSKKSQALAAEAKNNDYIKMNKDFQKTLK